jgi:hypothetical protein
VRPKADNLARCDALLAQAERLERDIRSLAAAMPPGVSNLTAYITRTADCTKVVVTRLNTAYNGIRRYDHA